MRPEREQVSAYFRYDTLLLRLYATRAYGTRAYDTRAPQEAVSNLGPERERVMAFAEESTADAFRSTCITIFILTRPERAKERERERESESEREREGGIESSAEPQVSAY